MPKNQQQGTSSTDPTTFIKGMVKDVDDSYFPRGSWYNMRNGVNNSKEGNEGTVGNEPSNVLCITDTVTGLHSTPFPIIGAIHLDKDRWAIFSTDSNGHNEIGLFHEDNCSYTALTNTFGQPMDRTNCLNFKDTNLIIGVAKENFDCTWQIYFSDALNPDRTVNIDKPAFTENCVITNGCDICTPTTLLDCDKLRLAPLLVTPCLSVSRGPNGGNILNGSYYAIVAYVLNSQKVTGYFLPSDIQAIFEHDNSSGSLLVTINDIDKVNFDYFELVIVRTTNGQTSAKRIGTYSTRQAQIFIDALPESLPDVPLEQIPLRTPSYETSDGTFEIGNYMLRVGPRAKFDFNYQPLANRITAKWQAVAYPSNYYGKGGNNTGYLRDEVYPFFIRWIYNTGDRSSSYHIPGRPSVASDVVPNASANNINVDPNPGNFKWDIYNTASGIYNPVGIAPALPDGGLPVGEGLMGYWESTERYPDKKPEVFNASSHPFSAITVPPYTGTTILQYDLCGNPIRHHKFPENNLIPHFQNNALTPPTINLFTGLPDPRDLQIIVLGVAFENILPPVKNDGSLIPGIVGYEILRGSREGNKTVIAKGILNNMRTYPLDNSPQTGLYQNYPYNFLGIDESLVNTENQGEFSPINDNPNRLSPVLGNVSGNQFTFHSPDTQFNNPFLSSKELKLYGELYGNVTGNFDECPKHPKEKLITDIAFITAALVGIGAAVLAIRGRKTTRQQIPRIDENKEHGAVVAGTGTSGLLEPIGEAIILTGKGIADTAYLAVEALELNPVTSPTTIGLVLTQALTGVNPADTAVNGIYTTLGLNPTSTPLYVNVDTEASNNDYIPPLLKTLGSITTFSQYWIMGTEAAMDLIRASIPYTQYAMRYTSHGFLNNYNPNPGTFRHELTNAIYLNDGLQEFGQNNNAKINNINRGRCVALQTLATTVPPLISTVDNTAQTIGSSTAIRSLSPLFKPFPTKTSNGSFASVNAKLEFSTSTVSHYAALKNRMRNQYGQLDGIVQVPVSTCITPAIPITAGTLVPSTGPLFNGDTYIGRYTEKNTFFYFWDWLYGQPDGYEFNYKLRYMLNFPRYWADFTKYDPAEFLQGIVTWITSGFSGPVGLPDDRHKLDGPVIGLSLLTSLIGIFRVTERYFYTFNSGIRDFFVESEINVDDRDWGNPIAERHYDPYRFTDVRALFEPSIIKAGNFFKYDQSLGVSRVFNNFFSWGNVQSRDYDPLVAETCFTYYKNRVIYSLPQNLEAKKDYWRVFLANNYKDFKSRVIAVEPVNKSGAMFFFLNGAPLQFQGVDTLQTELGTKVTIGDGGLFSQPEQAVVNANVAYEYGSCQNRLSVANTPVGLFWISENQGKIFRYSGQLKELSAINMKFWFTQYLPYQLVRDFPNFDLLDNPVAGIGCQTIFNNRDTVLYFAKKDFKLLPNLSVTVVYNPIGSLTNPGKFTVNGVVVELGDPTYFEDASWTLSFDPKDEAWQSFHDWHPDLMLPGKTDHLTIVKDPAGTGSIWKHTDSQLSFCNFYGIDYPFEIDYVAQTGESVNTLRSIEYFMEAHIYNTDAIDYYHVLDYNFDHAVIYNSEQVSGMLILVDAPKNNPVLSLTYPRINPTSIDILYSKVEQKYRFNDFWDITADRGEYTFPTVQRQIWQTQSNGYIRNLNPNNLNYQKSPFQRKKFRHFANHIVLTRNINKNIKMLLKLVNNKNLVSLR